MAVNGEHRPGGMKLKRAILVVMSHEALKAAVDSLEVANVDKRSAKAMRSRLSRARRATPEALLGKLRVADVRRVCELQGLSVAGRKPALRERLLEHDRSGAPPRPPAATAVGGDAQRTRPSNRKARAKHNPPNGGPNRAQPNGATTGFETELWAAANALRGNMDAAEYKHVVLGIIFLKYVSDAFEERHAQLEAERGEGSDPEDPDFYIGNNVFWVPPKARWPHLQARAKQPSIGQDVDDAMAAIEQDNESLRDVLPKDYARPALDKRRLGELIDLVGNIKVGDAEARSRDVLGRVYEYFLGSSPAPRANRAASSTPPVAS